MSASPSFRKTTLQGNNRSIKMAEEYKYRFSVFTSTLNRCQQLEKRYEELKRQPFKDLEWVVVNDGSTDDTEVVMHRIQSEGEIPVKFISFEKNRGKHIAWREALKVMEGRYVVTADDDDEILPDTLCTHNRRWLELEKEPTYDEFWEVRTRCLIKDPETGETRMTKLPSAIYDSDYIHVSYVLKVSEEMNGSRKLEVLRECAGVPPFKFEEHCSNLSEGIRWIRAARRYKTRFTEDVTRVYEPNPHGLCVSKPSRKRLYNSLVDAQLMLAENSDILWKYDKKGYLMAIARAGYKTAQLQLAVKKLQLGGVN